MESIDKSVFCGAQETQMYYSPLVCSIYLFIFYNEIKYRILIHKKLKRTKNQKPWKYKTGKDCVRHDRIWFGVWLGRS